MKNRLTFFLKMHGFVGLECESCADGKPANIKAGLYPGTAVPVCNDVIQSENDPHNIQRERRKDTIDSEIRTALPSTMSCGVPFIGTIGSDHPSLATGATTKNLAVIPLLKYKYIILNEDAVDGKKLCNASDDGINFKAHSGYFQKHLDLDRIYHVSYEINSADSKTVYNWIKNLAENEDPNYQYEWVGHNCLDFTREIYGLTSLEKKSFTGIYNLNPFISATGLNGGPGLYMVAKDTYEAASAHPVLALGVAYGLYGLYKWGSRRIGRKFNPEELTQSYREKHLKLIEEAKSILLNTIKSLKEPLNNARDAHNKYYGVAEYKDKYEEATTVYRAIRQCFNSCKETLDKVKQLAKDYDSLSKEYCSVQYAKEIISKVHDLPNLINDLADIDPILEKYASPFIKKQGDTTLKFHSE